MSQSPMTDTKDHDTTLESNAPVDDAIEMDKVISKSKRLNSGRSSKMKRTVDKVVNHPLLPVVE